MKTLKKIIVFFFCSYCLYSQNIKDCSSCSLKKINSIQIDDLSIDEIQFLINDLFARKGYNFKNSNISYYFSEKNWYAPVKDNNAIKLNNFEKYNTEVFKNKIALLKKARAKIISELAQLKTNIITANKTVLLEKNKFKINEKNTLYKRLKLVLKNIDINNINWFKSEGIYKTTIDNGNNIISYSIRINKNDITFKYDFDQGSEIGNSMYPSEYYMEYTDLWEFKWKNEQIVFIKTHGAG
ncbi:YARHG domain-containing protein [uncultured Tenacibaculum sp.]|uniref:YARHG domain-containing protein n=1 Tax=uncultured Tenacibaculum sp. TaxID=174713 RepID=UPI002611D927|nr:YARHG domain-containing protein [uncultured Tenacibaculum sp.]